MPEVIEIEAEVELLAPESQKQLELDYRKPTHEIFYLFLGILLQFVIVLIIAGVINHFTPLSKKDCIFLSALIWNNLLFNTPLIDVFFFKEPDYHAGVVTNSLLKYEAPKWVSDLTTLKDTRTMREVGPGWQVKMPWEGATYHIDLSKKVILGGTVTAYTRKGEDVELSIKYQLILTPLRTYLTNYVRHDEKTVYEYFEKKCRTFIQSMIHEMSEEEVFRKLEEIRDRFNKELFGGKNVLVFDEKQFAAYTNDPQLFDILRPKAYQDAIQAATIAEKRGLAVKKLLNTVNDGLPEENHINGSQALTAVLLQEGNDVEVRDLNLNFKGLEGLTGSFTMFPPGGKGQGSGNNKGNKGNKNNKGKNKKNEEEG